MGITRFLGNFIMVCRHRSDALLVILASAHAAAITAEAVAWQRAVAGMCAYCTATVVSSPVDVIKTRLQMIPKTEQVGTFPLAMSMLRNEGWIVFFSGIGPALLMAPAAMVQYTLIDPLRSMMPLFMAAAIAGTLDITIKCPCDGVKTRLQGAGAKASMSVSSLLQDAWKRNGIRGL